MTITWGMLDSGMTSVILLAAVVSKLRHPGAFHVSLRSALPDRLSSYSRRVARLVVVAEGLTALLLLLPLTRPLGLVMAGVLFLCFVVVALRSATGAATVDCACFGPATARLGWPHVVRNVALASVALAGVPSHWAAAVVPWDLVPAVVTGLAAFVLLSVFLDRLLVPVRSPVPEEARS